MTPRELNRVILPKKAVTLVAIKDSGSGFLFLANDRKTRLLPA